MGTCEGRGTWVPTWSECFALRFHVLQKKHPLHVPLHCTLAQAPLYHMCPRPLAGPHLWMAATTVARPCSSDTSAIHAQATGLYPAPTESIQTGVRGSSRTQRQAVSKDAMAGRDQMPPSEDTALRPTRIPLRPTIWSEPMAALGLHLAEP